MVRAVLISVFAIAAGLAISFAMSQRESAGDGTGAIKNQSEQAVRAGSSSRSSEPCVDCDFPSP